MHSKISSLSASGCGRERTINLESPQYFPLASLHCFSANFAVLEKKTYGYRERDELKRQAFGERLKTKSPQQIVYVDEAGIDNRDDYPYGYCKVGQRFHAAVFCGGIIPPQTNLLKSGKRVERVRSDCCPQIGQSICSDDLCRLL